MNDYTAHDIHRLDQAYPDALADIEAFTGDPKQKASLAAKGPEVFAAELTRDLAASAANPMSLAAWAGVATVQLMVAGKAWEDDTDAAWAKVDELTAELAEAQATAAVRQGQLTKSREQAAKLANEVGRLVAENARVRQQRDTKADIAKNRAGTITDLGDALNRAEQRANAHAAVVEAAKAWRDSDDIQMVGVDEIGEELVAAVDALPKAEATR